MLINLYTTRTIRRAAIRLCERSLSCWQERWRWIAISELRLAATIWSSHELVKEDFISTQNEVGIRENKTHCDSLDGRIQCCRHSEDHQCDVRSFRSRRPRESFIMKHWRVHITQGYTANCKVTSESVTTVKWTIEILQFTMQSYR